MLGGALRRLTPWRAHLIAAAVLAGGGTLLFGVLHALLIEPIWRRLLGGLPFALLAGAGMVWCYAELLARGRLRPDLVGGALFGALLWLALLPMTLVAAALRASGLRARLESAEVAIELLVAALTGALAAFAATRSWRAALAAAGCMVAVVLAMAGPIAVALGDTHRLLLLGFLPIYVAAGMVLSRLLRRAG